ncbi:MAG: type II toxin-antitoxin system VapB family antitoxin [Bryobacteraceae bacterium]|nr:type II toxin-antitoxin system VapB family antitoxin [Bryobacteraceae bacterium]
MTRTTLNLDEEQIRTLMKWTGIKRKTDLIHRALRELEHKLAIEHLADMGGKMPNAQAAPRRRSAI